ncbi:hypothetical protein [Variovorax sp. OV329]|uniref:hypothetical protein n=1 Tax=Variovorax sp. OV329 TaxID=1882825 RepID=UPI0008ECCDDC|nr:hypothetical protein [Variovorax sp. OV329]SFM44586.1 hypothetical protein SAMN05444747_105241 [Variovorax sp. OV329]
MFAALQSHDWAYPAFEALHVLGIALLLGNLVALEMRVFGRAAAIPVQPFARLSLTLALVGFGMAACTGALMFSTRPGELLANDYFLAKMALLVAAGCNALYFHLRGSLRRLDGLARAQMLLSTAIWVAVVFCGRWIAY